MRYFKQSKPWSCGSASMRMVLDSMGIRKSEKSIMRLLGTNKEGTGYFQLVGLCERLHLSYVVMRNSQIRDLKKCLKNGYCIIVNYYLEYDETGHYAVVRKIDGGNVHLLDPWRGPRKKYSLRHFKRIWFDYEGDVGWFLAVKKP